MMMSLLTWCHTDLCISLFHIQRKSRILSLVRDNAVHCRAAFSGSGHNSVTTGDVDLHYISHSFYCAVWRCSVRQIRLAAAALSAQTRSPQHPLSMGASLTPLSLVNYSEITLSPSQDSKGAARARTVCEEGCACFTWMQMSIWLQDFHRLLMQP